MPVNLDTVNAVFGKSLETPEDVLAELAARAIPRDPVSNAEDHLYATIGSELTNLFFRPYTKKMWGMELCQTAVSVVKRLRIRHDRDDRYFSDDIFQALPSEGYSAMFDRMLDHENIDIRLEYGYRSGMENSYDFCFNSMPIDEYFNFEFGELPYRSVKFHLIDRSRDSAESHTTLNYTDDEPFTRETLWHNISTLDVKPSSSVIATVEEPCDYKQNDMERYYPVKTADNRYEIILERYKSLSDAHKNMTFIGRCGTYQYLDMHQVVNQALTTSRKWLEA